MAASTLTAADEAALADMVFSFRHDPLGFVQAIFEWGKGDLARYPGPRQWQADILDHIGTRLRAGEAPGAVLMPILQAVSSGHGIGKSALVAWLILWAMGTMPDTRGRVTANTQSQLLGTTWPELKKWNNLALNRHWFDVQATRMISTAAGHESSWMFEAVTWSESNLEAFAGLHNLGKRILIVFDEASGIAPGVWDVAQGILTDADTEIIWFAPGNPTRPEGKFHQCFFGPERAKWNPIQIDARTVDGTNAQQAADWVAAYGEDSDFVRIRVRGQFPRAAENQFISPELVLAAVNRDVHTSLHDPLIMGVDVARSETGDQTVLRFRKGRDARSIPAIKIRSRDTYAIAVKIAEAVTKYGVDMVFVDGGGVGAGVVDALRQMRVRHIEVQFGGSANTAEGLQIAKFANKRAEMWGLCKDWLTRGSIPPDDELIKDLSGPHYSINLKGEILLEPKDIMKKRGLASPDDGDALALTFAGPVMAAANSGGPFGQMGGRPAKTEFDPWG